MAGQDQSRNLGGMLSQMGDALGSMGSAGNGLVAPIKQTFRPGVDPNDPESLRRAAQYQTNVGEVDAAKLYTVQAQALAEKQREAELRRKKGMVAQQLATAKQAIESGKLTPEQQSAIEEGLIANATDAGMDPTKLVGISQKIIDEKLNRETQQIRADAMRNEAADKAAIEQLSVQIGQATDAEQLDKIIADAGSYGTQAQQLANSRLQWLDTRKQLEDKAADLSTPIDTTSVEKMVEGLGEKERAAVQPLLDNLKKTQDKGFQNGTWITPTAAKGARAQHNALLNRLGEVAINDAARETAEDRALERDNEKKVKLLRLSTLSPVADEDVFRRARMLAGVDRKGDANAPTPDQIQQARVELRAERATSVESQIAMLEGREVERPEQGVEDDGGFSVKNSEGNVITRAYAMRAKERGITPRQLASASNITLEQAEVLMGRPVQSR